MSLQEISYKKGRFTIVFPYDRGIVDVVKGIPGRLFNGQKKSWSIPANTKTAPMVVDLGERYDFVVSDEAKSTFLERWERG